MISSVSTFKASSNCCRVGCSAKFLTDDMQVDSVCHDLPSSKKKKVYYLVTNVHEANAELKYYTGEEFRKHIGYQGDSHGNEWTSGLTCFCAHTSVETRRKGRDTPG